MSTGERNPVTDYPTSSTCTFLYLLNQTNPKWKKCSERCKHWAREVVRRSQKFSPRHRPPSRGCRMAKI